MMPATALPPAAGNPGRVTVPLAARKTWVAAVPEQDQARVRIAAEVAVTELAIAASLAVAVDLERSAAAEVVSAAVARGPAVPAAHPAWAVVAAVEAAVVGGDAKQKSAKDEL